jgi:hypothetical protein
MAKAFLKIIDSFVFCFPKNTVGYTDSIQNIPGFVSKYFIENVSTNFLLFDESYWNADYIEMSRLISKNLASTSAFFLEVDFSFSGKKLGEISYKPKFLKDSKVRVSVIENVGETEEDLFFKLHIEAELYWDYKASHFTKQLNHIEKKESTWEDAKDQIRINFRNNFILIDSMIYDENGKIVRDIKVCETWSTFRDKVKVEDRYFWQIIGYCFLYGAYKGYVDYVLIENYFEKEVPENFIKMENVIRNLPLTKKIKSFEISKEDVISNIPFAVSRIEKAERYYSTLTYEKCMKM